MTDADPIDMTDDHLYVNGIDATTGGYLVPPLTIADTAALLRGKPATENSTVSGLELPKPDVGVGAYLKHIWRAITKKHYGLPKGINPAIVAQAGWAIVFHEDEPAEIRKALEPLIEHRAKHVPADRYKVLTYKTGQTRTTWLAASHVGAGSVLPTRVPYYLLLVGGPARFPFTFCHELDVEYAVGCLEFETPAEYERYARSVVEYETSAAVPNDKRAVFFGTRHAYDRSTQQSADHLVSPLAARPLAGFSSTLIVGDKATRDALGGVFDGPAASKPPAILFTASHGMGWKTPDARQPMDQGALICQNWKAFTPLQPADYFAAGSLPATSRVHGLIAFHFACYGAGTPRDDRFMHKKGEPPPAIADKPFIAALPKALLSHAGGGALAVIGHVERAWGWSIGQAITGAQLLPFENALDTLAAGEPVGYALKDFNERYAALSTELSSLLEQVGFGATLSDVRLARAWAERNDAEGYMVLGDPAVALRVADM